MLVLTTVLAFVFSEKSLYFDTVPQAVQQCCDNGGSLSLSYDAMVELIEHLKACVEVASSRTVNWQTFCIKHETILSFLLQVN